MVEEEKGDEEEEELIWEGIEEENWNVFRPVGSRWSADL